MSATQGGRRQAMSYFRYASLVTDELAAETLSAAGTVPPAPAGDPLRVTEQASAGAASADEISAREEAASQVADAAGLTTALWRAAHALSPASPGAERSVGVAGPYTATAAREATPPSGGAGHLDRRG